MHVLECLNSNLLLPSVACSGQVQNQTVLPSPREDIIPIALNMFLQDQASYRDLCNGKIHSSAIPKNITTTVLPFQRWISLNQWLIAIGSFYPSILCLRSLVFPFSFVLWIVVLLLCKKNSLIGLSIFLIQFQVIPDNRVLSKRI